MCGPTSARPFFCLTGIKNNTHIIEEHTKLRTTLLSHTGIKINTSITLGEAFRNYCSPCLTGIKNNTRISKSTHYDLATLTPSHHGY